MLSGMPGLNPKADLHRYLQAARDAVVWKLNGISEYDIRRPVVPTGTCWDWSSIWPASSSGTSARPSAVRPTSPCRGSRTMPSRTRTCGRPQRSRGGDIVALYHRAWAHSDVTNELLALDAIGRVPWWPADRREVTLHTILVHMIAEIARHAGHADIVRELIDGSVGLRAGNDNMAPVEQAWWASQRSRLERVAREATE